MSATAAPTSASASASASRRRLRRRVLRALLSAALIVSSFAYLVNVLPFGSTVAEGGDGSFAINLAGTGPVPHVVFHRPATLDISSIARRRPTARMSLGVRTDQPQSQRVALVARLPGHARLTEVVVRPGNGPARHVALAPDFRGDLPTADGPLIVREFRDLGRAWHNAILLRIPVTATRVGTTVEVVGSVDGSRFTANGRPVGLRYVNVEFGRTDFVELPDVRNLPSEPGHRGPGLEVRIGIGKFRLRQSTAVPDPARTQPNVIAWTQPRTIAGIDVAMTVEDSARVTLMSWLGTVLSLLLGAWVGLVVDRLLLRRRRW